MNIRHGGSLGPRKGHRTFTGSLYPRDFLFFPRLKKTLIFEFFPLIVKITQHIQMLRNFLFFSEIKSSKAETIPEKYPRQWSI